MKETLVTLILTAFVIAGNAQTTETPASTQKFHFGLQATPSLSWFHSYSKDLVTNGSKFGFNYGLITEFNFAEHYAFSTGINITYRGGKFKQTVSSDSSGIPINTTYEGTTTIQYVELPLTLKLKTNEIGYMTYFLQFGVAPGVTIRARQDLKTTRQVGSAATTSTEETDIDVQKSINNVNVSMIIAAGLEYNLSGNTNLLTAITFNNGFLDVLDDSKYKANSNFLGLTIGVLF